MGAPSRVPEDLLCEPHPCNNSDVLGSLALLPHLISLSPLLYSKSWEQLWGLSWARAP